MKPEIRDKLENFQEEIREAAEKEEISYGNDAVYGMAMMLDSVLNEDLTVQDAVEEFINNSDLEIQVQNIDTQVIHR